MQYSVVPEIRLWIVVTFIISLALMAGCASAAAVDFTHEQGDDAEWLTVEFNGTVSGLESGVTVSSWSWNFGDGATGTGQNPSHTYTYTNYEDLDQTIIVTVTLSDNTTAGSTPRDITISYPELDAQFTATPLVLTGYPPFTIEVEDLTIGPHELEWDWGDSTAKSSISETSHTYESVGTYALKLSVTRTDLESSEMEKQVIVKSPTVAAAFSANKTEGIVPMTVKFTDDSSGDVSSWSWEIEDETTASGESFEYTFETVGNYSVRLSITGTGGETDSEEKLGYILVKPNITAGFTAKPTSGDNPLTVQFTDTSTGYNINGWYWEFGDDRHSTSTNPEHIYTYAGEYDVSLKVSNDQGSVTIVKDNYIVVNHEDATETPTPAATTEAPAYSVTTPVPTEEVIAANSAANLPGTKIFGIPGTEFFRTEIGRIYSLYKEYLFFITHLS